ncbi:hypothetical protein ACHAWU_009866 [Discostella pseudostelligera]|uniref:HTH La-type RNA-binding domain-containing protein n=1 Tax=Discostella pseudostelligera TaxID=259834 RepID=A0ABD3M2Q2_9STRA
MQSEMTDRSSRGNDQLLISTTEIDASQESVYTRLRTQVEFYFSPKNLSRDTYLRKMLTSEHLDIPTPRPAQYMCPVGIITNFPKVKDICSQFSPRLQKEPAALLLARALEGSNSVVTISSDGNWIGPVNQILPPPTVLGVPPAGMEGAMGQQLPPRIPPQFPPQGYQHPPPLVDSMSNPMHQGMMGTVPPPPPPPVPVQQKQHQHRGEGQGFMYQKQQERPSPMGSESPSSTSLESLPQHQQQQQAYVSNLPLPSSKNSVGGTQASLSSMSDVGAKGGQPMTFLGPQGGGVTSFPQGPSHQHYGGGGGGQKKRVEKKKHKNNQQPQHQQQHNTQRDSYGSSTSGTTGSKNNESEGHHNNFQRRGSSPTPPIGEHHRGGSGGDKFKKSGSGEQHSQYRRDNSNSSPSGFNNRSYNRQKQQHQHSDRSSSSDAIPSTSSNSQQRRQSKADENKEIFTSSDFPGLGGGEADEQQLQSSDKKPNSNLVGYASALLKKKDVPKAEESKSNVGKSTASTSPSKSAPSPTMKKAENQSHETDDIGQEIQAGLQELSLVGNDGNVHADSKQRELSHGHDNDANETEVCRTSTCAAGLGSEQTDANNSVSNSPARPDSGGMDAKHELKPTSESLSTISLPVIDVFNSDEFPAREAPNETGNVASRGTLPPTEIAAQPSEVPNDPHSTHRDEKPKPTGAWGSKRLFADVSLFSAAFLTNLILLSQLTPTPL